MKIERYIKPSLLVVADLVLLTFSFVFSCVLVKSVPQWSFLSWLQGLFLIVGIQLIIFLKFGLYRAVLRYASIDFLITVLKAVTAATLGVVLVLYFLQAAIPVQVVIADWLLTVAFIGGSRFIIRYYFELRLRFQKGKRVLIYGAGDMGSIALRQLAMNKAELYSPIGFVDDDHKKVGTVIRGIKVLGTLDELEDIIDRYGVQEVVVAIAEIESENLNAVVRRCREKHIICRIIPCFSRLVEIEPDIRAVELADLMRRTPRDLDEDTIKAYITGRTVMITGAAGSIGSELVRQCLRYGPKKILAIDQSEYGLYALEEELGRDKAKYVLCDITNINSLEHIFSDARPDLVFHAAAYKHVPLLENNPSEGVRNNIQSTRNLCELSNKYKVKSFVMISTDKAVRPSSIMGATKKICELIVQNFNARSDTEFVAVRFGNVLGSSGSVVPKFIEQIRNGGPVTVTHPDATRYFMLIDEAVRLVLQAAAIGNGGEIFILDMGRPVRIKDMAEDLIYLMGRQPHKDIKISFTGLRSGEKIHEELFNDEIEKPTKFKEITVGRSKNVNWDWLNEQIDRLLERSLIGDSKQTISIMKEIVPEGIFAADDNGAGKI